MQMDPCIILLLCLIHYIGSTMNLASDVVIIHFTLCIVHLEGP